MYAFSFRRLKSMEIICRSPKTENQFSLPSLFLISFFSTFFRRFFTRALCFGCSVGCKVGVAAEADVSEVVGIFMSALADVGMEVGAVVG